MVTKNQNIAIEQLTPGVFERELLVKPSNLYMAEVFGLLAENPEVLDKLLSNKNTALLFFMWISYGGFANRKLPNQLKNMPDMLWKSLVKHQWIELYASGDMDCVLSQDYGMRLSVPGHRLCTAISLDQFSKFFQSYLHRMYRLLNDKNRSDFQNIVPVSDAVEFFNNNYDGYFSVNEYIPIINRLNRKMDISSVLSGLFNRISVSSSMREMVQDFEKKKDPAKFPILWERLAGHPDYGTLMLDLSRTLDVWFKVHYFKEKSAKHDSDLLQKQK